MKFDFGTISIWLAAFAPVLALALTLALDRRIRRRDEKPPQEEKLLRQPGHSLAIRLEETLDAVLTDVLTACAITGFAGAFAIVFVQLLAGQIRSFWLILSGAFLAAVAVIGISKAVQAYRRLGEAQNIRLGLRGEQAVAEALYETADCGFRAFHDFPGGKDWNVDHIAVGSRGVFVIETKACRRRGSRNGQREHEVIYDGQVLQFPTGANRDAIPQAQRNAKSVSAYLTKKTGEPVKVEPLVVLPGWFVKGSAILKSKS